MVWGYANKFYGLEKMLVGGGGGVMPKYFMDLKKKCWGGGVYAKIFYGLEKMFGGMPTNFVYGLKKKIGGGGGYAQIFY